MGEAHANALARLPMFFPDAPAVERTVLVGRDEDALAAATDRLGFAETAADSGGEFHPSFEDALRVQEVLAAIERSDGTGERVAV